jgi:RNA polymerase sigma-70 factor, ECF subfamily
MDVSYGEVAHSRSHVKKRPADQVQEGPSLDTGSLHGRSSQMSSSSLSRTERHLSQLLSAAVGGDDRAYALFLTDLTRHIRPNLRRHLVGRNADVEDVLQEILIAVHGGLNSFRPDVPVTAWISAIVRYKLADLFRSDARHISVFEPLSEEIAENAAERSTLEPYEANRDLERLLGTLPPQQRDAIVETKLAGRSVSEAAERTGLSESAVKVYVHRGLKTLSAKLRNRSNEY